MKLPRTGEFDPDGDLYLVLLDHGDALTLLVEHLKKTSRLPIPLGNSRTRRTIQEQTKNWTAATTPDSLSSLASVDDENPSEIRLKVSSKHLALASPVFKALLQRNFAEGAALAAQGTAEVRLPDDNAAAFWILLYLIHGQPKRVPSTVTLEMLARVTVLIDKYELHEVAENATDSWLHLLAITNLPKIISGEACSALELLQWLSISWVLGKQERFTTVMLAATTNISSRLSSEVASEFPIPAPVLDQIEDARVGAIGTCIGLVQQHMSTYQKANTVCRKDHGSKCDAMALGSLLRALALKDFYPFPTSPYDGFAFRKVSDLLGSITFQSLCDIETRRINSYSGCNDAVSQNLRPYVEKARSRLKGIWFSS